MKKILITGGPVHGKLDDVKMITNRFKGGLIAKLADELAETESVVYLTSKGSKLPKNENIEVLFHDGIFDYMDVVLRMAPEMDAVILGGAVANLVPQEPIVGKFPSHNYKEGDVINIPFVIAPRIIDKVKEVAPKTHLFGFKLLSNVSHEELIEAAYGVVLESKATCIFANDTNDLNKKYAVTKEHSVIELTTDTYAQFIKDAIYDEYYRTIVNVDEIHIPHETITKFNNLRDLYTPFFEKVYANKYKFGTIAMKLPNGRILTTGRGKREMDELSVIDYVDYANRVVYSIGKKSTLNAGLIAYLFNTNPNLEYVVHYHEDCENLPHLPYAFPGTDRDCLREIHESFVIDNHGTFILGFKEN